MLVGSKKRQSTTFLVVVTGQITEITCPEASNIDCTYVYHKGDEWQLISGMEQATSQLNYPSSVEGQQGKFVLNFPLEATFKASCPFGWPRLCLKCSGHDFLGKSVLRGYGAVSIPLTQGRHTRTVALFTPEPSSELQRLANWFTNRRPEFYDATFVARADSREVTRVSSRGLCTIELNVVTSNLKPLGYDTNAVSLRTPSEWPMQLYNDNDNNQTSTSNNPQERRNSAAGEVATSSASAAQATPSPAYLDTVHEDEDS